jgi:hypothetical protein
MSPTGDRLNQAEPMVYWKFCLVWMPTSSILPSYDSPLFQKFAGVTRSLQLFDRSAYWGDDLHFLGICKDHWISGRRMRVGLLDGEVGERVVSTITYSPLSLA